MVWCGRFHGSEVGVKDEVSVVEGLVSEYQGGAFDWANDKAKRDALWEGRKGALWATMAYKPENQVWTTDVCVPISRLADLIQSTKKDIEDSGILAPIVGHVGQTHQTTHRSTPHTAPPWPQLSPSSCSPCLLLLCVAGDGNFHVMLSINPKDEKEMALAKGLNQRMVQRAIEMEGTCTGEHGVGVGKRDYLEHELGVSTVDTMRRLKKALDPHGLMNPGKVFRLKEDAGGGGQHGEQQELHDDEHEGGMLSRLKGLLHRAEGNLMHDQHDLRPEHAAMTGATSYVGAPAGKPEGDPPASKHDTTPPPERSK